MRQPAGRWRLCLPRAHSCLATSTRSIRTASTVSGVTTFTLIAPMPFPVLAGDTFTAYPGCDKKYSTCGTWGNQANFGGQDQIPAPETAI